MWSFFQFLNDDCTLTILDIGAAMVVTPSYQDLVDMKRARLIGFEPDAQACARLNEAHGKPHLFLPVFVGDGKPAVFHETNWGPTGSLFAPNTPLLEKFHRLSELVTPVAQHPITTVRLDDIAEVDDVDFIKIDVQGSELGIFRNASRALADAVLIQTEVSFLELYKHQPMFSDVDAYLRGCGFQFHDFPEMGSRSFKPVMSPHHPYLGFRQRLWADVYYVKDWMNWDVLPPEKLKKLAALLHDIVGSYDLAHLALAAMDRQLGSQEAPRYLRRLQEGGHCAVSGEDSRVNRSADVDRQAAVAGDQNLVFPPGADGCLSEGKVRRVLNVGGNSREIQLPSHYAGWQQVLLDIDPDCTPDVLCDARDLFTLPGAEYDSVYCSHNLEHYYRHDVGKVLSGFFHVLKEDGFAFIRVPDMVSVMQTMVQNDLDVDDILYQSEAGPISVNDVVYGFGAEIERSGNDFFAHKTGFSQHSLISTLKAAGFPQVFSACGDFEIAVYAFKRNPSPYFAKLLNLSGSAAEEKEFAGRKVTSVNPAGVSRTAIFLSTTGGISVSVPATLDCITTYVLLEQERWFEREVDFVLRWLKPGMNAVDVGANVGVYCLPMARAAGSAGKVFAFEPGGENRRHLELGRTENGLDKLFISACALSDSEKEGWLEIGSSGELNSLIEGSTAARGNAERVRVSTLDAQAQECAWPPIDFLKIDAEGQEARIVAGGRNFFQEQSPLVMYEVKNGVSHSHHLRWMFEALGYATYRLLGDASCLVPLGSDESLDSYELNLFAAKPDRAARIAAEGLLVAESANYFLNEAERKEAIGHMLDLPYARSFEFSQNDVQQCAYGDALVAYAAYRFVELSPARRYAALSAAYELLRGHCAATPTPTALASLIRVALDLGRRLVAVETLAQLLGMAGEPIDQPFFPPCQRYEGLAAEGREADWFSAAAIEQMEISQAHSSRFADKGLDRLGALCASPFASAEISRRAILRSAVTGMGLRDLARFLNPSYQHRNPTYWSSAGLVEISSLL